jgi:formate hydrogenlyase subunit 3/multisubunit Na+/H+ antiporter MnhD subunit
MTRVPESSHSGALVLAPTSERIIIMELGKLLIVFGLVLVAAGLVLMFLGRVNFHLGRLPGDFVYRGKNTSVYFPLATSILLSVLLSVLLYALGRWKR